MDVQCERCKTEYEFDDALVSGRGTTVRCTNCGHQFKVRRGDAQTQVEEDLWVVTRGDGRQVSFGTLRELQRAILAKQVSRNDVLERHGAPPRQLGAIAELEPFLQGRTSSRPPPADTASNTADGVTFPKRSAVWQGDGQANPSLTPPVPVVVPARRTNSYGSVIETPRPKMDTLRPPATGTAAPPPAGPAPIHPQPIVRAAPQRTSQPMFAPEDAEPSTRRPPPAPPGPRAGRMASTPEMSSPLPPPMRPLRTSIPAGEGEGPSMRPSMPSSEAYSTPRGRRTGGWVVSLVLLLAVGVVGWVVAKPYLVSRSAATVAAHLDPRAQGFVTEGERALADGNLDLAKENFDKASALAEGDQHVLLDQARLACALADLPWLKTKLLLSALAVPAPDLVDEARATKAQLDERVARARRAADDALAAAPADVAATRTKIDALRLAGERDAARAFVSKVISQASQPETAYVLAALDLAEPEPLWTTVLDRLRFAAAGEGSAGRARAALVYALVKSGDGTGAKAELAKLDALPRPYPLLAPLHAYVDKGAAKAVQDAGAAAATKPEGPVAAAGAAAQPPSGGAPAAAPAPAAGGGGGGGGDGMQAATQAIRKGDWERARQIYDALVARNPNDSEALCGIGDVARAQGDSAGAVAAYKRVISTNPSYLPALLGIADTQWATGDRASATKGYRDIADRFPEGSYPSYVKQRAEGPAASPVAAAPSTSASKPPAAPPRDPSAAAGE